MSKILFLFLFVLLNTLQSYGSSNEYPICTSLHYSGTLQTSNTKIFEYEFDLSVSFNDNNATFNNKLELSNFSWNATTDTIVEPILPVLFYFGANSVFTECISNAVDREASESCQAAFPNYIINPRFGLNISSGKEEDEIVMISNDIGIFVNDALFFNGENGEFFTAESSCMSSTNALDDTDYTVDQKACCNNFNQISFSTALNETCEIFQSHLDLYDQASNESIILKAIYFVQESKIELNFTLITSSSYGYYYTIGFNNDDKNKCKFYDEITNVVITSTCMLNGDTADDSSDKQLELIFNFGYVDESPVYEGVIIGEIIIRDERYFKDVNVPYTLADSCWSRSADVPTDEPDVNDATYNSSFCCTAFKRNNPTTVIGDDTTSTSSTATTTTSTSTTTTTKTTSSNPPSSSSSSSSTTTATTKTSNPQKTTTKTSATSQASKTTENDDNYTPTDVSNGVTIEKAATTSIITKSTPTTTTASSSAIYFGVISLNFLCLQILLHTAVIFFIYHF